MIDYGNCYKETVYKEKNFAKHLELEFIWNSWMMVLWSFVNNADE